MELLILSHFQEASDFQTFLSLVDQELQVFSFFRGTEGLWFFDELVYVNYSKRVYGSFESGIKIKGKEEGFWIRWYVKGIKNSEGFYRNGKQEGFWIWWYGNGIKYSEGSYQNGLREGLWTKWYDNGEKELEGSFRNDLLINKIFLK